MMKMLTRAPGKLILIGEYAVLEGARAAVAAIDRLAIFEGQPSADNFFHISAPVLSINSLPFSIDDALHCQFAETIDPPTSKKLHFFITAFEQGLQLLTDASSLPPIDITLNTDAFFLPGRNEKLGLGSSAALTVALLGGIYEFGAMTYADDASRRRFFDHALKIHHLAQGKMGSGIDVAASVFGGVLQYEVITEADQQTALIEEIQLPPDLYMLIVYSGKPASTRELVAQTTQFRQKSPAEYQRIMDEMQDLSFEACHALANEETKLFLELADRYHDAMDLLGSKSDAPIISPEHQAMAKIARSNGASYKPSGAGGGDMGIVFSSDPDLIKTVGSELDNAGFEILQMQIAQSGVENVEQKET